MGKSNKGEILALTATIDWNDLDGWVRKRMNLPSQNSIQKVIGLVLDNMDEFVRFPEKPLLLWKGCVRKGDSKEKHVFPGRLKEVLKKWKIKTDSRGNGPAINTFLFAGGQRPARNQPSRGWNIHHLYDGKITYHGREASLHAVKDGNHFTQSAGLVAVHPVADALCDEVPAFAWYLRGLSLKRFGYDPDGVYPGGRPDEFGFLHPHKTQVIYP